MRIDICRLFFRKSYIPFIDTHCIVWFSVYMATNLSIDEKLLDEAKELGRFKTKRETVNMALQEFIQRRRQLEVLSLYDSIDYNADYNYKAERKKK